MKLKISARSGEYFDLFADSARNQRVATELLQDLIENYEDVSAKAERIRDREHEGDEITHEMIRRLNTTFVTPFDREDIHRLASNLDDVLDHVEAAAEYLQLHKIESPLPQMLALAEILQKAASTTATAMPSLRRMKGLDDYWVEINRLENDGDRAYRRTIAELFSGDYKAMDVLKFKEIIEEIEHGIDRLEDVANTIESIALEQG